MKTPLVYILLFLSGPLSLRAQEIRAGGGIHFNFKRQFRIETESQYRFLYLAPEINRSFIQGAFRYESASGLGSKFTYRNGLDIFNRDRYSLDFFYDKERDKKIFSLGARIRLQTTTDPEESLNSGNQRIRLKVASNFRVSKIAKPYQNIEVFYRINKTNSVERIRLSFGLNSRLCSTFRLNTFYKIDYQFYKIQNKFEHIIGCMIVYRIKYHKQSGFDDGLIDL